MARVNLESVLFHNLRAGSDRVFLGSEELPSAFHGGGDFLLVADVLRQNVTHLTVIVAQRIAGVHIREAVILRSQTRRRQ